MNKLSQEKQTQLAIIIVVTLAALAAVWFLILDTEQKNLEAARRRSSEFRDKVERAENLLKKKDAIETQQKRDAEELAAIEDGLAAGDKYGWFVPLLTKFSEPYKNISIVKVEKERAKDIEMLPKFPYSGASFHIIVTAFYVDFGRFLADFENKYPYFQIQGLEMVPTTSPSEDHEKLDIKFDIVTLVKPTAEQ